jgi:hypothetical protein
MDIHKPKPIRNWREFLKEYAIIVLGVVTALTGEQMVEKLRDHVRSEEARANIRNEISGDLTSIQVRAATEKCVSKRLDEVDGLIRQATLGKPAQDVTWIGRPPIFTMPDGGYRSETQAGHVNLLPSTEQTSYAIIYAALAQYYQAEEAEQKAWADFRVLEDQPSISAVMDWQLRSAVKQARTARWTMEVYGREATQRAKQLGVNPPDAINYFRLQSICIPVNTPRADAVKLVAQNRSTKAIYDEP